MNKDDDIVQDGGKVTVPMLMMDSAWHRPGYRQQPKALRDASGAAEHRRQAYQDYDDYITNQWRDEYKNPAWRGQSGEIRGSKEGDPCTRNGWRGTLVLGADGKLTCQIPTRADADFLDQRRKKQLRNQFSQEVGTEELEQDGTCPLCGRGGDDDDDNGSVNEEVRRTSTHHEGSVRQDVPDHRSSDRQRAYDQYDHELANAWRRS
jgi:hypothetical protein